MDNIVNSTLYATLYRLLPSIAAGATLHISAWLVGSTTTCVRKTEELSGLVCRGGVGLRVSVILFAIGFLGTPILLTVLFRRASQAHPAFLAWSAQTLVPAATYGLLHLLDSTHVAGAAMVWEGATQLVAAPVYIVLLGRSLQGNRAGETTDRGSA